MAYLINQATIDLVKRWEGKRLKSYQDSVGVWTIGYGLTTRAGIGVAVGPNMHITDEQAEEYLVRVLEKFAERISPMFTQYTPTPNQFGAMLSLAYNIGPGAFAKSTCLRRFNDGDVKGAAEALQWFNKAGGKTLRGLVNRRADEAALMLTNASAEPTPRADDIRDHPTQSKTVRAGGVTAAVGAAGGVFGALGDLDPTAQYIVLGGGVLVLLLALYIIKDRLRKWAEGVR